MKKRIAAIMLTVMIALTAGMPAVFAANGFALEKSTPANGYDKVQAQNVMVKLYFTNEVAGKETRTANSDKFKFTDSDGDALEYKIYYDEKEKNKICILSVNDLEIEETYTLTISGDLVDDKGQALGADEVVKFTTRGNTSGKLYGVLMLVMIVAMVFITIRDNKKTQEAETPASSNIPTNPYKLAKERNISVEEANRIIAQEREKAAKKDEKRRQKEEAAYEAKKAAERAKKNIYRVHSKRVVKRK